MVFNHSIKIKLANNEEEETFSPIYCPICILWKTVGLPQMRLFSKMKPGPIIEIRPGHRLKMGHGPISDLVPGPVSFFGPGPIMDLEYNLISGRPTVFQKMHIG